LTGKTSKPTMNPSEEELVCKNCGIRYRDFERTGLFGCPRCYDAFFEALKVLLRRIHGSDKHIGSRPFKLRQRGKSQDLNQLREQLQVAISNQDYEKAAHLRDLIKDIERQLG